MGSLDMYDLTEKIGDCEQSTDIIILKSFMCSISTLDAQLQQSGKESVTHKPVIGGEHLKLKQLEASVVCSLSSSLSLLQL